MIRPGQLRLAPVVGVLVALLVAGLTGMERSAVHKGTWTLADFWVVDAWTRLASNDAPAEPVHLVLIDDRTLEAEPTLLERRSEMARLVAGIHDAGARVVGIDLFFAYDERILSPALTTDLAEWIADPEPETPPKAASLLERTHEETVGDAQLEEAIRAGKTVLAAHFGAGGELATHDRSLTRGTYAQVVPGEKLPIPGDRMIASLPRFNQAAAAIGVITVPDDAGTVRRIPLAARSERRHFVPFAFQLVAAYEGLKRSKLAFLGNEGTAVLGDRRVASHDNMMWLDWQAADRYPSISALDVLDETPEAGVLEDKLVLLGFSHLVHDRVDTPFGSVPGVYVHAAAADNLLRGAWLSRAPAWQDAVFTGACGFGVAMVFAIPGLRTGGRLAGIVVGLGVAIGVPGALRLTQGIWIGAVGPVLAVGGAGFASAAVAWVREGAEARAVRRLFAHYVSDDLVEAMVADPSLVQLRGERRELSVLFSDIRDFTSFSEQLAPLELVAFLNAYLTPMTRAVLDNRGFVDKFIGDAVMALFGAPVPDHDHAANACRTALAMHEALAALAPMAREFGIDLAIGVGVNTGEVAVGNMGSEERFEYTVLGDAVNLSSRLEGLTKTYGVFCIVGQATAAALPPEFRLRAIDLVRVKGKGEPVEIFELCGDSRLSVVEYRSLDVWDRAVSAFRSGAFDAARHGFAAFADSHPDDPVCRLYQGRLDALGDQAPAGWDGVFTHTHK